MIAIHQFAQNHFKNMVKEVLINILSAYFVCVRILWKQNHKINLPQSNKHQYQYWSRSREIGRANNRDHSINYNKLK